MSNPLSSLAKRLYDRHIRPRRPRHRSQLNGVTVDTYKHRPHTDPTYEAPIPTLIQKHVEPGYHVVVVGGGHGVSTVHAAQQGATVDVYEGAYTHADIIQDSLHLNLDDPGRVTVHHAVVGPAVDVWGDDTRAVHIPPEGLPRCDVLVLDCEGAETDILANLEGSMPRAMIVETHANRGSPASAVFEVLAERGYQVRAHGQPPVMILEATRDD